MRKAAKFMCVMALIAMMMSCSVFEGVLGDLGIGDIGKALFSKYSSNTLVLDALYRDSAEFEDISPEDQWGLVWNGMFGVFYETTKQDSMPDMYRLALKAGLGISPECFETLDHKSTPITNYSTGDVTGYTEAYTTYKYRVNNKEEIQQLAELGLEILDRQKDPATLIKWMEDWYKEIEDTGEGYNSFALKPYLEKLMAKAEELFEYEAATTAPDTLNDDSFGAQAAKLYLEEYPDGYFLDIATARQQASAGTEAELVL